MNPTDPPRANRHRLASGLFLLALPFGCGDTATDREEDPASRQDQVRATLTAFQQSVERQDLDAIVEFFSGSYSSREASGKPAVRAWWERLIETGLIEQLPFDPDTAVITAGPDTAQVIYYDERGELACTNPNEPCDSPQPYLDFRLDRDEQDRWLITGIPSEQQEG